MMSEDNYLDLFRFRGDTFAIQQGDGSYVRVMRPPTRDDLRKHFDHSATIAMYPSMNNLCFVGCLDYDLPKSERNNLEAHAELRVKISAGYEMFEDLGIRALTEATGGRGYHLWVFSELVPTPMMYDLLRRISEATLAEAEIFPIDGFGLGKAIRPPLGSHRVYGGVSTFVDPHTFEPIDITDEDAKEISENRITKEFLEMLGIHEVKEQTRRIDSEFSYDAIPKARNFQEVLESMRPCFQEVYNSAIDTSGGQGWSFMTAAAAEVYANGGDDQAVHDYFSVQAQYNPKETNKHLKPIKRKNLLPFRCSRLQETCSDFVTEYCANCHIFKQHQLSEKIDEVVDKSQGKEDRNEGGIDETLEQFSHIAMDLNDIMSGEEYTLITNSFNSGKTWSTIAFLKHAIHAEGRRINFITPSKKIKEIMMDRMQKAEVNFIDNPSNMDLCPRAPKFKKLGYIPTMVCKRCSMYTPIQKLVKPITDDFVENADKPFYGTVEYFKEKGDEYGTCGKWAYLATLEATREENMVLLMTAAKLKHHFFIPDSPLIPALTSDQTYCNVVDQIDFVNRVIPKITFSEKEVYRKMKLLGLLFIEDLDDAKVRIEKALEMGDLDLETLDEMEAIDYLTSWLHAQKMFDEGILRRVKNAYNPELYHYDFMGTKELHFILNDVMGKKINPKLYDSTLNYIKNIEIDTYDDIPRAPKTFKEVLEDFTECGAVLGITSTPSELECMNSHWLSKYHNCSGTALKNLYSIPNSVDILPDVGIDDRTIIFSRKQDGEDFINDSLVRGNTGTGGKKDEVIIRALQYPKHSESVMADLIQLCGGNFGKGIKAFYEGIVSDALTQAHKYDAEKIIVPNPEIFCSLGFDLKIHDDLTMTYWEEKVREKFDGAEFLYKNRFDMIPEDIMTALVEKGVVKIDGKRYYLAQTFITEDNI
jgi:hypothetical protein